MRGIRTNQFFRITCPVSGPGSLAGRIPQSRWLTWQRVCGKDEQGLRTPQKAWKRIRDMRAAHHPRMDGGVFRTTAAFGTHRGAGWSGVYEHGGSQRTESGPRMSMFYAAVT